MDIVQSKNDVKWCVFKTFDFQIFIAKLILDSARESRNLVQPYYQDYIAVDDNQKGYRVKDTHQEGYRVIDTHQEGYRVIDTHQEGYTRHQGDYRASNNQGDYRAANNQAEAFNEEDNVEYYELGARPKYNPAVHSQVIHYQISHYSLQKGVFHFKSSLSDSELSDKVLVIIV